MLVVSGPYSWTNHWQEVWKVQAPPLELRLFQNRLGLLRDEIILTSLRFVLVYYDPLWALFSITYTVGPRLKKQPLSGALLIITVEEKGVLESLALALQFSSLEVTCHFHAQHINSDWVSCPIQPQGGRVHRRRGHQKYFKTAPITSTGVNLCYYRDEGRGSEW